MSARRRVLRLLTLGGLVRVTICPLCGALVVHDGRDRHAAVHAADVARPNGGR